MQFEYREDANELQEHMEEWYGQAASASEEAETDSDYDDKEEPTIDDDFDLDEPRPI